MDIFAFAERLMTMDDDAWARHANPWSVYSRFSSLPLIALAIWSRDWLGWWFLLPLMLALAWTWINPRLFSPPERTDTWAARGTYGERVFLNRKVVPIPKHHEDMAITLTWLSAAGVPILVYGLAVLDVSATVCGLVTTILPKLWFCDRMVWLYDEMGRPPMPPRAVSDLT